MIKATAVIAAGLLGLTALVHLIWAAGGVWPARDGSALAKAVVGPGQEAMPAAAATLVVVALLSVAAVIVVARAEGADLGGPGWVVRIGTWVIVCVLAARGLIGLVTSLLAGREQIYHQLDIAVYSPLCLLIAVLCLPAALA